MAQAAGPTAALAGVPTGLQSQGVWVGRRQLFVRFAAEAETATMYTAQAIAQELQRAAKRSAFHSISVGGRDPLANVDFLAAAFKAGPLPLPVMLAVPVKNGAVRRNCHSGAKPYSNRGLRTKRCS